MPRTSSCRDTVERSKWISRMVRRRWRKPMAYNPQKTGFFVFPLDPQSNNLRILAPAKAAQLRCVPTTAGLILVRGQEAKTEILDKGDHDAKSS
jgi:hypothetical protein